MTNNANTTNQYVTRYSDISPTEISSLLKPFGLSVTQVQSETIPGSYWGESEAGLINNTLYVRNDTPLHSVLHEACHYICMDKERREQLNTDAGGDYDEENAVCYLQILLTDQLISFNRNNMLTDMDSWGYTFRLGSARRWFEEDAQDAKNWLIDKNIILENEQLSLKM